MSCFFLMTLFSFSSLAESNPYACKSDSDCVMVSTCNVVSVARRITVMANEEQYEYSANANIFFVKQPVGCDVKFLNFRAPEGSDKLIAKCVKKSCELRMKK